MKRESLFRGTLEDQEIQQESFNNAKETAEKIVKGDPKATIRVSRKDRAKQPGNSEVYEEKS